MATNAPSEQMTYAMILIILFDLKKFNIMKNAKGYINDLCTQQSLHGAQFRTSEKYNENAVALIGINHISKRAFGINNSLNFIFKVGENLVIITPSKNNQQSIVKPVAMFTARLAFRSLGKAAAFEAIII